MRYINLKIAAVALVTIAMVGQGFANMILNPSFELGTPGGTPTDWAGASFFKTLATIGGLSGTATGSYVGQVNAMDGVSNYGSQNLTQHFVDGATYTLTAAIGRRNDYDGNWANEVDWRLSLNYADTGAEVDGLSGTINNAATGSLVDKSFVYVANATDAAHAIQIRILGSTVGKTSDWGFHTYGAISADNVVLQVPVPEPGTLVLLGAGLIGLLASAWRKRRRTTMQTLTVGLLMAFIVLGAATCSVQAASYPSFTNTPLSVDLDLNDYRLTTVGDVLAKGPRVDVRAFGATGDGSTDDSTAIQAALNSIPGSGGVLYFPAGIYITGPISLRSGLFIQGDGPGITIIQLKAGSNDSVLKGSTTTDIYSVSIRDIGVDGNKANQTAGHGMDLTGVLESYIHNCAISNTKQDGIYVNGYNRATYGGRISKVLIWLPDGHGINFIYMFNARVDDVYVEQAGVWGFQLEASSGNEFTACYGDFGMGGFHLYGSTKNTFVGCKAFDATTVPGIFLETGANGNIITGCEVLSSRSQSDGFRVYNSFNNVITGGRVEGSANIGIREDGTSDSNVFVGIETGNNAGGNTSFTSGTCTFALGIVGRDSGIKGHLAATATWDPASIANGAATSTTVTVPGAAVGDIAYATHSQLGAGNVLISAHVQAANTVRVVVENLTGSSLNIASGTVRVNVWRY